MKIIITEDQYNKLILKEDYNYQYFKRRLNDMLDFAIEPIETDLYRDSFCSNFISFYNGFVASLVNRMMDYYNVDGDYNISKFVYDIGPEKFRKMLLDKHGERIREYYLLRSQDC
jgi:hypothetical protein